MGRKLLSPSTDCSRLSGNASQLVAICCMTKLFLGRHDTHVHSPQIGKTWQTKYGYHQSSTWWTIEFYWGYLQNQKWLKRQLHYHGPPSTSDHSQKLRTWSTLCNLQAAQGIGESFFQVSLFRQLVWLQSLQLGLSENQLHSPAFIVYSGREGPSEFGQF